MALEALLCGVAAIGVLSVRAKAVEASRGWVARDEEPFCAVGEEDADGFTTTVVMVTACGFGRKVRATPPAGAEEGSVRGARRGEGEATDYNTRDAPGGGAMGDRPGRKTTRRGLW